MLSAWSNTNLVAAVDPIACNKSSAVTIRIYRLLPDSVLLCIIRVNGNDSQVLDGTAVQKDDGQIDPSSLLESLPTKSHHSNMESNQLDWNSTQMGIAWSEDGKALAYWCCNRLRIWYSYNYLNQWSLAVDENFNICSKRGCCNTNSPKMSTNDIEGHYTQDTRKLLKLKFLNPDHISYIIRETHISAPLTTPGPRNRASIISEGKPPILGTNDSSKDMKDTLQMCENEGNPNGSNNALNQISDDKSKSRRYAIYEEEARGPYAAVTGIGFTAIFDDGTVSIIHYDYEALGIIRSLVQKAGSGIGVRANVHHVATLASTTLPAWDSSTFKTSKSNVDLCFQARNKVLVVRSDLIVPDPGSEPKASVKITKYVLAVNDCGHALYTRSKTECNRAISQMEAQEVISSLDPIPENSLKVITNYSQSFDFKNPNTTSTNSIQSATNASSMMKVGESGSNNSSLVLEDWSFAKISKIKLDRSGINVALLLSMGELEQIDYFNGQISNDAEDSKPSKRLLRATTLGSPSLSLLLALNLGVDHVNARSQDTESSSAMTIDEKRTMRKLQIPSFSSFKPIKTEIPTANVQGQIKIIHKRPYICDFDIGNEMIVSYNSSGKPFMFPMWASKRSYLRRLNTGYGDVATAGGGSGYFAGGESHTSYLDAPGYLSAGGILSGDIPSVFSYSQSPHISQSGRNRRNSYMLQQPQEIFSKNELYITDLFSNPQSYFKISAPGLLYLADGTLYKRRRSYSSNIEQLAEKVSTGLPIDGSGSPDKKTMNLDSLDDQTVLLKASQALYTKKYGTSMSNTTKVGKSVSSFISGIMVSPNEACFALCATRPIFSNQRGFFKLEPVGNRYDPLLNGYYAEFTTMKVIAAILNGTSWIDILSYYPGNTSPRRLLDMCIELKVPGFLFRSSLRDSPSMQSDSMETNHEVNRRQSITTGTNSSQAGTLTQPFENFFACYYNAIGDARKYDVIQTATYLRNVYTPLQSLIMSCGGLTESFQFHGEFLDAILPLVAWCQQLFIAILLGYLAALEKRTSIPANFNAKKIQNVELSRHVTLLMHRTSRQQLLYLSQALSLLPTHIAAIRPKLLVAHPKLRKQFDQIDGIFNRYNINYKALHNWLIKVHNYFAYNMPKVSIDTDASTISADKGSTSMQKDGSKPPLHPGTNSSASQQNSVTTTPANTETASSNSIAELDRLERELLYLGEVGDYYLELQESLRETFLGCIKDIFPVHDANTPDTQPLTTTEVARLALSRLLRYSDRAYLNLPSLASRAMWSISDTTQGPITQSVLAGVNLSRRQLYDVGTKMPLPIVIGRDCNFIFEPATQAADEFFRGNRVTDYSPAKVARRALSCVRPTTNSSVGNSESPSHGPELKLCLECGGVAIANVALKVSTLIAARLERHRLVQMGGIADPVEDIGVGGIPGISRGVLYVHSLFDRRCPCGGNWIVQTVHH